MLIGALVRGMGVIKAAEFAGVHPRTAKRRVADPGFRAELDAARANLLSIIAEDVMVGAMEGVAVLRKIAGDDTQPAAARVTAASRLTELALGTRYEIERTTVVVSEAPETAADKMRAYLARVARNQTAIPALIEATATDTTGETDADHPESPMAPPPPAS